MRKVPDIIYIVPLDAIASEEVVQAPIWYFQ